MGGGGTTDIQKDLTSISRIAILFHLLLQIYAVKSASRKRDKRLYSIRFLDHKEEKRFVTFSIR